MIPTTVIEMIVDRQHVGASHRSVIKALVRAHKRGYSTWRQKSRKTRRGWMRHAILAHNANRQMYREVMGGV